MPYDYDMLCENMGDTISNERRSCARNDQNDTPQPPLISELDDEEDSPDHVHVDGGEEC